MQESQTVRLLQLEIAQWADQHFPNRTAHNALSKLMLEELPELISGNLSDPLEFADVLILVLDIAHLQDINIADAVRAKMEINRNRAWNIDPETGLLKHIPGENL